MIVSTEKRSNECDSQEMVEYGRVPGKGRIRASIEKTVSANTENMSNECEYRKNGRIHAIIEKVSGRVPEKDRISVSTEKW